MTKYKHCFVAVCLAIDIYIGTYSLIPAVALLYLLDWRTRRQDRDRRIAQIENQLRPTEPKMQHVIHVYVADDLVGHPQPNTEYVFHTSVKLPVGWHKNFKAAGLSLPLGRHPIRSSGCGDPTCSSNHGAVRLTTAQRLAARTRLDARRKLKGRTP